MRIVPFDRQLELIAAVLDPEITVVIYGGGIRGGKTFAALIAMFLYLRKHRGAKAHIVRDSRPTLFRNTVPSFNKITPTKSVENEQQLGVPIPYRGSEINFFAENYDSDKELDRWKGLETNFFLLEEFPELNQKTFDKAIERVGSWIIPDVATEDQPPPKIVCTCNPTSNWVKERIYDKWRKGDLPKGWVYIPALAGDNPHLPQAYLNNLLNLPAKHYNVFVKGIWEDLKPEDLFAEEFDEDTQVTADPMEPDWRYPLHLSFDFNVYNTCLVIQKIPLPNGTAELRVLKEYHERDGIQALCKHIQQDYPKALFKFSGDASGAARSGLTAGNIGYWHMIHAAFGYHKSNWKAFSVPASNPSHSNSYLLTNVVHKHYKVKIAAACVGLKRDLKSVLYKDGKIDKSDETLTHHLDPWRYFLNAYCQEAYRYIPESLRQAA